MKEKTTRQKFREVMIDMHKGYPEFIYYPKNFKDKFGENYLSVISTLENDGILTRGNDGKGIEGFRLTDRGFDIANSIVTLTFTRETHYFTEILILMTFGLFIFAYFQAIISLWF